MIIQSDRFSASTAAVALTSTSAGAAIYRPEFELDGTKTRILTDQIHSVSPNRFGEFNGSLEADELADLDRALMLRFGLIRPHKNTEPDPTRAHSATRSTVETLRRRTPTPHGTRGEPQPAASRRMAGTADSSVLVYSCSGSSSTCSTSPTSTISPWYITATRSAMFHARPRSWVMTSVERPRSTRRRSSRARISPRTVASSDATGSSATSTRGWSTRAPAMTTRWR
ncbi:hypothetical protein SACE_2197 [Saccharopolyspora erythraea NRRL 2338]|uniref:Uncharacterized protein n=1 Tax=Saccharopolyspora erythraea (strain ATCC 11635 / DSM 40517 / JCM 4748 / NBRC 13426 / NCIMB 8594 / NRRL 2338) TaxID=405948 RepID=A4FBS8_SACEN|nr:hypothetical protein SACE_2197 [Saccharopolyspora erythraea NRRL 2338]